MIDDVTVTARLSTPIDFTGPTVPRHRTDPSGRTLTWEVTCGQGVAVAACNETQDIEVRLSFPRLANHHPCNFPLRRTTDVNLRDAERQVSNLVGSEVFRSAGDLTHWGVRRIAFAVDPHVEDVPRVLESLAARPRRGSSPQRWGHPARGLQWDGASVRLQLYKKSDEILNRIRHLRGQQGDLERASVELRRELARRAETVLRWEVTLKNAKGIRTLLGIPGGWLPRLRPFLDDEIGSYVLGREFSKLNLHHAVEQAAATRGVDVLALARTIGEAARCAPPVRSGRSLQGTRLMAAAFLHQIHGLAEPAELQAALRVSARAYADLRRDLHRIGIPPLGTTDPSGHDYVARFAQAMLDEVVEFPPWLSQTPRDEDLVRAPWADRLPEQDVAKYEEFADDALVVQPRSSRITRAVAACDYEPEIEMLEQGALIPDDDDEEQPEYYWSEYPPQERPGYDPTDDDHDWEDEEDEDGDDEDDA